MDKHCWICKNTEEFFLKQKEDLINSIDQELEACENYEESIIDTTKEKLGFTDESKSQVKKIKKEYSEMTLRAVLENRDNFIKFEPNLNIIIDYCLIYKKQNLKTVKEVIEDYLLEPIESRYVNDLRENERRKALLLQQKTKLEQIKTFFIEKEITPRTLDSELQKLKQEQYNYRSVRKNNSAENDFSFSYKNLGFDFSKKIFICPVCLSLFAESANASFDIIEAQRRAQQEADEDWDDDDF